MYSILETYVKVSLKPKKFTNFPYFQCYNPIFVEFSSHFHLDHCGALPYMSEMVGYEGPIYMTHPTKAICPILLVRSMLITYQ